MVAPDEAEVGSVPMKPNGDTANVADRVAETLLVRIFWVMVSGVLIVSGGMLTGAYWLGTFTTEFTELKTDVSGITEAVDVVVDEFRPRIRAVEEAIAVGILAEARRSVERLEQADKAFDHRIDKLEGAKR